MDRTKAQDNTLTVTFCDTGIISSKTNLNTKQPLKISQARDKGYNLNSAEPNTDAEIQTQFDKGPQCIV